MAFEQGRFAALRVPAHVVGILGICLVINAAIFMTILMHRPAYLEDYRLSGEPDGRDYVRLGRNLLLNGHYSRCEKPPYVPDMLRTPVYPFFVGTLDVLGGAGAIYLVQALLEVGGGYLLYLLGRRMFGGVAATWTTLLFSTDTALATYNFLPLSESLYVFLLIAAALALFPVITKRVGETRWTMWRATGGGLLLAVAILTRPTALYLPVLCAAACVVVALFQGGARRAFGIAVILMVTAWLPAAGWIARNARVFSLPRLTTVDASNLVYFVGAGAYQLRHGVTREQAQAMITEEFGLEPYADAQNPHHSGVSVSRVDARLREVAPMVLRKHPRHLVLASALAVVKASVSHTTGELARLAGRQWIAPGAGSLLHGSAGALTRLRENGGILVAIFIEQLVHALVSLGMALVGVVMAVKDKRTRTVGLFLLVVLAYSYLTVALFGVDAYSRARLPVLPFLYLFAGYGIARLLGRWKSIRMARGGCGG